MRKMIFFILLVLPTAFSSAKLGERSDSIVADRSSLGNASLKSTQRRANYTVSELESDGTTIREYISNDGVVFAVTWQGIRHPDLSILLGSYYASYRIAKNLRLRTLGHQPSEVQTDALIVRHAGHMRDLHGKAFVSDLVPTGVDVEGLE